MDKKLNLGVSIEADSHVEFSDKFVKDVEYFNGFASTLLATPYKFSRKQEEKGDAKISVGEFANKNYILELVQARLRAKDWANTRADEANPGYFLKKAESIFNAAKEKHGEKVKLTVIKGNQLLDEGFRLMHAVGRASLNEPIFINLFFTNNPNSS